MTYTHHDHHRETSCRIQIIEDELSLLRSQGSNHVTYLTPLGGTVDCNCDRCRLWSSCFSHADSHAMKSYCDNVVSVNSLNAISNYKDKAKPLHLRIKEPGQNSNPQISHEQKVQHSSDTSKETSELINDVFEESCADVSTIHHGYGKMLPTLYVSHSLPSRGKCKNKSRSGNGWLPRFQYTERR